MDEVKTKQQITKNLSACGTKLQKIQRGKMSMKIVIEIFRESKRIQRSPQL